MRVRRKTGCRSFEALQRVEGMGIHGASEKYAVTSKSNRTRASTGSTDPGTVQTPAERATQRLPSRLDDPAA